MRINSILLFLSLSFITISSCEKFDITDKLNLATSRNLLSLKNHHNKPQNNFIKTNHPEKNVKHNVDNSVKHNVDNPVKHNVDKPLKKNFSKKTVKNLKKNRVNRLDLVNQNGKPIQPKYFFDDIFQGFNSVEEFQETFPAEYFSFASQKFTANTILVNIRNPNKIEPVELFVSGVINAFNTPGVEFVAVDEINPNSFSRKKGGKYDKNEMNKNADNFLKKLKFFGENPKYQGRINVFITNLSPRFFSNYPDFAIFISEILRLAHNNYIGIVYSENYRAPITASFANVCLTSSNNRQGCIDSLNAPLNSYQWSSTKNSPKSAINNFRALMKTLCGECDVNKLVMPTFGLSNINGVSLNNCFKNGGDCMDDLDRLSDLVIELKDESHIAFYGAAHVTDTSNLIIHNGDNYDVEALYCEIISATYPELNKCL